MFSATSFDKTLIILINTASVALACGMLLFTLYTFADLPDATNGFWGIGTLTPQIMDCYSCIRF